MKKKPMKKIVTNQLVPTNIIHYKIGFKYSSRNYGILSYANCKNTHPPSLYLLLMKCFLLLPFHSSTIKLPKHSIKKSKNAAHVINIPRVIGFHILNTFTNERASLKTGQSSQVSPCACAWKNKIAKSAAHCTLYRQYLTNVRHKKTDFTLFEKGRKIFKCTMYFRLQQLSKKHRFPSNLTINLCMLIYVISIRRTRLQYLLVLLNANVIVLYEDNQLGINRTSDWLPLVLSFFANDQ